MCLPFIPLYLQYCRFNGRAFCFTSVLQILLQVLDMVPSYFGIRLAALGSRKEFVDLENWLSSNLTTYKDVFFEVMIDISTISSSLVHYSPTHGIMGWAIWNPAFRTLCSIIHYNLQPLLVFIRFDGEIVRLAEINASASRSASNSWRRFNLPYLRMFLPTSLTLLVVFRTFIRRQVLLSWRFYLYQLVVLLSHVEFYFLIRGDLWSVCLQVLQAHTGLIISSQLSDEVGKLTFMNTNSRMKSSGGTDSSPSDGYTDDIEAEANSYFDQMFSGQLTIDTMIQMLARFKESPENR